MSSGAHPQGIAADHPLLRRRPVRYRVPAHDRGAARGVHPLHVARAPAAGALRSGAGNASAGQGAMIAHKSHLPDQQRKDARHPAA